MATAAEGEVEWRITGVGGERSLRFSVTVPPDRRHLPAVRELLGRLAVSSGFVPAEAAAIAGAILASVARALSVAEGREGTVEITVEVRADQRVFEITMAVATTDGAAPGWFTGPMPAALWDHAVLGSVMDRIEVEQTARCCLCRVEKRLPAATA